MFCGVEALSVARFHFSKSSTGTPVASQTNRSIAALPAFRLRKEGTVLAVKGRAQDLGWLSYV
eukprot:16167459-Heterocapsa_arctica.AAC.1